jgi:hypothetical protein
MSSLPLISHHLFVAAIQEEQGLPPKHAPNKIVIELPEATHSRPGQPDHGEPPGPGPASGASPARAGICEF